MSVSSSSSQNAEFELTNPDVVTKYQTAAGIANKALETVLKACVSGAEASDLCLLGDKVINEETGKVYNKKVKGKDSDAKKDDGKKVEKGVGFPTCVSINEVAGHFSPLKGESQKLEGGDVVKVDLGVHIDGFIAQVAHTVIVAPGKDDCKEDPKNTINEDKKFTDNRADVVQCAETMAQAAVRVMQPGNTNNQVTEVFQKVADEFKCHVISGVLSHELKRYIIDGSNVIISKTNLNDEQKVDEFEFGSNEAFTVDIMVSTGEGKLKEKETRHTVYKRAVENNYQLKTQKARQFLSEINAKHPSLPFSLRAFEDEQCARVGVSEAKRHNLLHEYPVMAEKQGEYIAQMKFTVLLLPGGVKKITGLDFNTVENRVESSLSVQNPELKDLLARSLAPRKKRNKAKKEKKEE